MSNKGRLLFDEGAREKRRWTLWAAAACVVAGACMLFGIGQSFQLKIQDLWYGLRGDRDPSPQVVIVGIDGKSLNAQEERWPWPRDTYVPLIDTLSEAGAKVIGFDIAFSRSTDGDGQFAEAMLKHGNVVFGMVFNNAGDRSPPSRVPPPEVTDQAVPEFDAPFLRVIPAPGVEPPATVLAEAAAAVGHVAMLPSIDGTLRRIPTLIQHGENAYPAFAVQVARVYADVPLEEIEVTEDQLRVGYADIPIAQTGEALVNFSTRDLGYAFPTYSVVDILRGDVGRAELDGKAVLVAMTAEGLDDRKFPFGMTHPGVILHATFLDNFFTVNFLKTPGWSIGLELGLFLVLAALAIVLFPRLPTPVLMVTAPVLLLGVLGLSVFFFVTKSIWWAPLYPCLAVIFPFATSVFFKLRTTEREKEVEVAKVRQAEEKLVEAELEKGLAFQEKGSLDLADAPGRSRYPAGGRSIGADDLAAAAGRDTDPGARSVGCRDARCRRTGRADPADGRGGDSGPGTHIYPGPDSNADADTATVGDTDAYSDADRYAEHARHHARDRADARPARQPIPGDPEAGQGGYGRGLSR
jgi:adenylate cyclase